MRRSPLLLLETDPQLLVALELFLRGRGFSVVTASTPGEALRLASGDSAEAQALKKSGVTVVVGNLPDSTDVQAVAQRLRATLAPGPVHIVVLAHAIDDIVGVDLVIPVDSHPRALLDGLRTVARRALPRSLEPLPPAPLRVNRRA
jgi:DNA-binding response OmpR family regulator